MYLAYLWFKDAIVFTVKKVPNRVSRKGTTGSCTSITHCKPKSEGKNWPKFFEWTKDPMYKFRHFGAKNRFA